MIISVILDTNVILAFLNEEKDKDLEAIQRILKMISGKKINGFISSLTLAEIYGFYTQKSEHKKAVEAEVFLEELGINILDVTKDIARNGGFLKGKYSKNELSYADCIIASTASKINSIVITYDLQFSAIDNVISLKPEEFLD